MRMNSRTNKGKKSTEPLTGLEKKVRKDLNRLAQEKSSFIGQRQVWGVVKQMGRTEVLELIEDLQQCKSY